MIEAIDFDPGVPIGVLLVGETSPQICDNWDMHYHGGIMVEYICQDVPLKVFIPWHRIERITQERL